MAETSDITVRPDSKGRIALGAFAKGVSSFRVHQQEGGKLVLEPYAEIPARELWLHTNTKALAMVKQGLNQYGEGKIVSRGSFKKYRDE